MRATQHLRALLEALRTQNWVRAYEISWQEFQDMHQLFTSCQNPFSYISEQSHEILTHLQKKWQHDGDGPLITMDAGPNIHLLYREDQAQLAQQLKTDRVIGRYDVL
jgi:diphosphomevalonate decarboxylase